MKKDFISEYKQQYNLNDEWERRARQEVINLKTNTGTQNNNSQDYNENCKSVGLIGKGGATILWLIVAAGALIFKGGWVISLIATVVWLNYILE